MLAEADAAARSGRHVAGFVSYDAAAAFDRAFRVPGTDGSGGRSARPRLPLAWFGIFAEAHPAPALPPVTAPALPSLPSVAVVGSGRPDDQAWDCEIDAAAHAAGMGVIRNAIAEGDAYLVNLTTRYRRRWPDLEDPLVLYADLVAGYGGGYHAFIDTGDWAVASASPELFFDWSEGQLTTRPMKGTAPRGRWSDEDLDRAEALSRSGKERAENVMVVDMLRNDLGRIACRSSVKVPFLWRLEQHPFLWQMTSAVTAAVPDETGLADVFGALFPSASVTGAPKISAMSVIADIERSPRGLYCGAIGYLAPAPATSTAAGRGGSSGGRSARFAVVIRTAVVDRALGMAEFGSGGGITWDSDDRQEWAEVQLKARSLTEARPPALGPEDGLIETMAFDPPASVRHLADHLARLSSSARYFGLSVPPDMAGIVTEATRGLTRPSRVRLVLRRNGPVAIETSGIETSGIETSGIVAPHIRPRPHTAPPPIRLCIDLEPVSSSDVMLFHKTTNRRCYDERLARHGHADDVVLVNERGEVTETTRANLAVRIQGHWYTPPLTTGLLPGIERARSLADGRLTERTLTVADLRAGTAVATLSSLRGWRAAFLLPACVHQPDL